MNSTRQPNNQPRVRRASLARRTKWKARRLGKAYAWFMALSWKKKLLVIGVPLVVVLLIIPFATYLYFARDISDKDHLMNRNNTGVVLYANDNKTVLYSTGRAERRDIVPLSSISKDMQNAVIASEDKEFYKHKGFSPLSTLRAVYTFAVTGGKTFGGSTLTQQLAKITLLSSNRTFLRTYQAFSVAVAIENTYTKDEILEMYLNSAYFGEQAFGIEDAAKYYFGTTPDKLTLAQSSMLVGLLPAPNIYSPISGNPEYAKERQSTVLKRMVDNGYITSEQKAATEAEVLTYQPAQSAISESMAPHFAQMVMEELNEKYGEETVQRSGFKVKTTLDPTLQQTLQDNIANHLSFIQANGGSNAGGIAIDPLNGDVKALVGSADWDNEQWGKVNMATTARQPGSSFKSIYYAEALAEGVITPATILHDEPTDFGGYKPLDADKRFRGDVTVRSAISQSLNIPSVEVMEKLGTKSAVSAAKRMGLAAIDDKQDYGLSLALGTAEVPLIQMTNAYAAFANAGQQYTPTVIEQINDKYDSSIFKSSRKSKEVISPQGAYLISSILSDNQARSPIFGSSLTVAGRTAAVKTGTTDDSRDAWTIGYTPQLALGVWVGNNNNETMLNGGSGMAGPIWVRTMQKALSGQPNTQFTVPENIVKRSVCYGTGGLATTSGTNTYEEYFLVTALPTASCTATQAPKQEEKPKEEEPKTDKKDEKDSTSGNGTTPPTGNGNGNTNNGSNNGDGSTPSDGDGSTSPTDPTDPTAPTTP
jgi:1A family penicillin-binding protein